MILVLFLSFLNMLAMLIQVLTKSKLDQGHILEYIYVKCFQIDLQVIMYHFEHINHDTHLDLLF